MHFFVLLCARIVSLAQLLHGSIPLYSTKKGLPQMKFKHLHKLILLAVGTVLFFNSCSSTIEEKTEFANAHNYDAQVFIKWNELFLEIDRFADGNRPGPAPRALAYMGLSAYEGVVSGIPENNSLESLYSGLDIPDAETDKEYYWPAVVNASYGYLMQRFFFQLETQYPELYGKIEAMERQLNAEYAGKTTAEILDRSTKYGIAVASAVYSYSQTDVTTHNAFLNPRPAEYNPPTGAGKWQPTYPDYGKAMFPYWGKARTFALKEAEKLCKPPIPYSENPNSLFYTQAMEVYNTVNMINNPAPGQEALAYDERWKAIFWSDDILNLTFGPPPRLIAVLDQVVGAQKTDLAGAAELYAKMGLALNDAGVSLWHSKYFYNVERPVSYIQRVVAQNIPAAANWNTIMLNTNSGQYETPSFPAYPSGHSGFGGAGAKILSSYFEYNQRNPGTYTFTDLCHVNRVEFIGTPRTFASFKDLGDEDAYSRIPLGVHFRMDCVEGVRVGELAAQRVLELPWKK